MRGCLLRLVLFWPARTRCCVHMKSVWSICSSTKRLWLGMYRWCGVVVCGMYVVVSCTLDIFKDKAIAGPNLILQSRKGFLASVATRWHHYCQVWCNLEQQMFSDVKRCRNPGIGDFCGCTNTFVHQRVVQISDQAYDRQKKEIEQDGDGGRMFSKILGGWWLVKANKKRTSSKWPQFCATCLGLWWH